MSAPGYSLVTLANGVRSIRSHAEAETFHPVIGPAAEAEALYVRQLDLAGRMAAAEILGRELPPPPPDTAMGALITHITGGADAKTFQPMNVNFGLFPPIEAKGGRKGRKDRYKAYTDQAKDSFTQWLAAQ